jgi:peptidoglycan-associated lipoprotein
MDMRRWQLSILVLVIVGLVGAGCAKRPSARQASAPPPAGAATAGAATAEESGPVTPAPSGPEEPAQGGATGGGTTVTRPASVESGIRAEPGRVAPEPATVAPATVAVAPKAEESPVTEAAPSDSGAPVGGSTVTSPGNVESPPPAEPAQPEVAAARPVPPAYAARAELPDIYFDFDKYNIRPDAAQVLDAHAEWLKSNPSWVILVEGHCDERGTSEYNLALGQHRARSTLNYLISRGVQATRITTVSYGKERPLCTEHTEKCWARDRRAHFLAKGQ